MSRPDHEALYGPEFLYLDNAFRSIVQWETQRNVTSCLSFWIERGPVPDVLLDATLAALWRRTTPNERQNGNG